MIGERSYREFEILVIPRKSGQFEIPGVSVSLFDPDKKVFYQQTTPPLRLEVLPGDSETSPPSSSSIQSPSIKQGADGANSPLVSDGAFQELATKYRGELNFLNSWANFLWTLLFAVSSLFLVAYAWKRFSGRRTLQNLEGVVKRRFKRVHLLHDAGDWRQAAR